MININFPVVELIDRLAIAEVKFEKTQLNQTEVDYYRQQFDCYDFTRVQDAFTKLKDIHRMIWSLEADLRQGNEGQHDLAEIGRRAIAIRDWNRTRIELKNNIAELLNCAVREIKRDHRSE